ncbi:uncharacterized protein LOC135239572 [Anguilla rostrata]|uniref:uncharacterized protein LOC135239572 n=1 Tax=Anguilla rostrata TaxID=7938 RepID=UPI0030CCFB97
MDDAEEGRPSPTTLAAGAPPQGAAVKLSAPSLSETGAQTGPTFGEGGSEDAARGLSSPGPPKRAGEERERRGTYATGTRRSTEPDRARSDRAGLEEPDRARSDRAGLEEPDRARSDRAGLEEPDRARSERAGLEEPDRARSERTGLEEPDRARSDRAGLEEPDRARSERTGLEEPETESTEEPLLSGGVDQPGGREAGRGAGTTAQRDQDAENKGPAREGEGGSADAIAEECPVCTEPLGAPGGGGRAALHCGHAVCRACLAGMLGRSADPTRLRCPLCRQSTPLPAWEIRRMQEEAASHAGGGGGGSGGADAALLAPPPSPSPPTRGPERWLEARVEARVGAVAVCGCLRLPVGAALALRRLRRRCRCCYLTCLLLLYLTELTCLLLVFLPVLVLVLLFTLAGT